MKIKIKPREEFMKKMSVNHDPQIFSSRHSGALIWNKNSNHKSLLAIVNQRDNRNSLNLNTDYVGSDSQQQDLITSTPYMWVEFVGSLLCFERVFSRLSGSPLSPRTKTLFGLICCDSV